MKSRKEKSKETTNRLSDRIRQIMKEKNLTAQKVADVAKARGFSLSGGYLGKVLNGEVASPSLDRIEAMAAGLGVNPLDLCRAGLGQHEGDVLDELTEFGDKIQRLRGADAIYFRELIHMIDLDADRRLRQLG